LTIVDARARLLKRLAKKKHSPNVDGRGKHLRPRKMWMFTVREKAQEQQIYHSAESTQFSSASRGIGQQ
jgi:hypothetical protein